MKNIGTDRSLIAVLEGLALAAALELPLAPDAVVLALEPPSPPVAVELPVALAVEAVLVAAALINELGMSPDVGVLSDRVII